MFAIKKTQSLDFVFRVLAIILKIASVFLIIKLDKYILAEIYLYTTLSALIFKGVTLSELNNYRRLCSGSLYKKISYIYFINCLFRLSIIFLLIIFILSAVNSPINTYALVLFCLASFLNVYLSTHYLINSNQLKASITNFSGSLILLMSIIITFFIKGESLEVIGLIYSLITISSIIILLVSSKNDMLINKKETTRLIKYIFFKNFNFLFLIQLKRSFFALSGYLILVIIAYFVSRFNELNIDLKNVIILLMYFSNIANLFFNSFFVFPHVLKMTKGTFKFKHYDIINLSIIFLILSNIILVFIFSKYTQLITITISIFISTFLSFIISVQGFYIAARTVTIKYIFSFFLITILCVAGIFYFNNSIFFIPLILILPRLSFVILNKFYFSKS